MTVRTDIVVSCAVEGITDEAVLLRILAELKVKPGIVHGRNGKNFLRQRINGYNQAAHYSPWIVLLDLDNDAKCAPDLKTIWMPHPAPLLCFRFAVREIESWLLADRERLAQYLGISTRWIPINSDELSDPKRVIVDLAARSRRRDIREDMVPCPGGLRPVGPAYASRIIEFVKNPEAGWRPFVAAEYSNSLKRCLQAIKRLMSRR